MMRSVAAAFLLTVGAAAAQPLDDPALEAEAQRIHREVIALDTHVDIPLDYASETHDPGGFTDLQVDLPSMRAGGLDAVFLIVYTAQGPLTPEGYAAAKDNAVTKAEAIQRLTAAYPDQIGLALSAGDARAISRSGRKIAFIGMENAYPLGESVADVEAWRRAGVRYCGITHFGHNQFGDSSNPNTEAGDREERHGGLSELGRALVAELNRVGVMVDVSHTGRKTMMQATALSKAPIIASHSAVKALADSPRNLDDEQLRAIAASGGVAQIVALGSYIKPLNDEQIALRDKIRKEMGLDKPGAMASMTDAMGKEFAKRLEALYEIAPRATVADFVDHIDYAVKVAGIDHVGIASDFDGGGGVAGWEDASQTINVTRELVRRGYSEEDIAKIWSGNLLRVLDDVEKTAKRLQKHK